MPVKKAVKPVEDQPKIHVLIVEDDSFLANIYKTKFEMEGFRVSVSDNGETGLTDAQKKKPDIILLDILLPKMDGFVVLEHLRADKEMRNTPVILLTNLGQKDDVEKGLELGASDYLIKAHFKPSETVAKVRKVLKERGKSA
jgi:DNA-binding response OmpR family regulator